MPLYFTLWAWRKTSNTKLIFLDNIIARKPPSVIVFGVLYFLESPLRSYLRLHHLDIHCRVVSFLCSSSAPCTMNGVIAVTTITFVACSEVVVVSTK